MDVDLYRTCVTTNYRGRGDDHRGLKTVTLVSLVISGVVETVGDTSGVSRMVVPGTSKVTVSGVVGLSYFLVWRNLGLYDVRDVNHGSRYHVMSQ